ncbi:MAG: PilZ domain-containing protein [Myxococcota bacterium]
MAYAAVQKFPRYAMHTPVMVVTRAGGAVQMLNTENVSLGGLFVRTNSPVSPGMEVTVRFGDVGNVVGGVARVVHVIHESESARKLHPPGMGLEFHDLPKPSHVALLRLVEGLAAHAPAAPSFRHEPRLKSNTTVRVQIPGREALAELAASNLSKGGLFVETPDPPAVGTRLTVQLTTPGGALTLHAEVVHRLDDAKARAFGQKPGAGLQFVDYDNEKRRELARYLDGRSQSLGGELHEPAPTPQLLEALNAARRLFEGLDKQDAFGAVGLEPTAAESVIHVRLATLHGLFRIPLTGATPAQEQKVRSAARVLPRVEQTLMRIIDERHRPRSAAQEAGVQDETALKVQSAITRAARLQERGHIKEARGVLLTALEQIPGHPGLSARVEELTRMMTQRP